MGGIKQFLQGVPTTHSAEIIELPRQETFEDLSDDCRRACLALSEHDEQRHRLKDQYKHCQARLADFIKRNVQAAGFNPEDINDVASKLPQPTEPEGFE